LTVVLLCHEKISSPIHQIRLPDGRRISAVYGAGGDFLVVSFFLQLLIMQDSGTPGFTPIVQYLI